MASKKAETPIEEEETGNEKYKDIVWTRWPNFEEWMAVNQPHVKYIYHQEFDSENRVDRKRSRKNMARLGKAVNDDSVQTMLILNRRMRLYLPASVGWSNPEAKNPLDVVLADGNHRDEVVIRRHMSQMIAMYELLDIGEVTFGEISKALNVMVGHGSDVDSCLTHCNDVHVANPDRPIKSIADEYGVSASRLSDYIRRRKLERRFLSDGDLPVPGYETLNKKALVHLIKLRNDRVLHELARGLAGIKTLTADRVQQAVTVILGVRPSTEAKQLEAVFSQVAAIQDEYTRPRSVVFQRGPKTPGAKLISATTRYLNSMEAINPVDLSRRVGDLGLDEEDRLALVKDLNDVKKRINQLMKKEDD